MKALMPRLMCVSGVYFFHFRVITAIFIYNMCLCIGVGNAMLPKISRRSEDS